MNPKYNNQEGNLVTNTDKNPGQVETKLDFLNRLNKYHKNIQKGVDAAWNGFWNAAFKTGGLSDLVSTNTEQENEIERNKNLNSGNKNQQY